MSHYPDTITETAAFESAEDPVEEPGDEPSADEAGPTARRRSVVVRVRDIDWHRFGRPFPVGRFRMHPAAAITGVVTLVWIGIFGALAVQHHQNFGTWSFDMGIYDQGYWLVSHFKPTFVTVRGLDFWGQHINLIAYLYAPFYWLGAGPTFLMATQAASLGAGAVPVYLIARDKLNPWHGLGFAGAFLLYPAVQFIAWANYHPEAMVITPFLFAWWFAQRQRWRAYYLMVALVLIIREDAALAVMVLGLVLWVLHWRRRHAADAVTGRGRWVPGITLFGGAAWYLFCTKLAIPHFNNGEEPFYVAYFYSDWGTTMGQVGANIVRHPNRVVSAATKPDRIRFYRDLALPLGGFPIAGLGFLAMAGPQMLASVIGTSPYARMITYQYTSVMIAPIFVAAIEGYRRVIRPRSWHRWAMAWMLGCALVTNIAWSPSPIGERNEIWARPTSRVAVLQRAVDMVPDDASLAATFSILPHLAHRERVYDWPNPWRIAYWGNRNENPPNPVTVEYMVLDLRHVSEADQTTVSELTGPGGEFEVLMNTEDVMVAHRVKAPSLQSG